MTPETTAIFWHALLKTADKEARRELLTDGARHEVALAVDGSIDGAAIGRVRIAGALTVGHEQARASSVGPKPAAVLALVLAKLSKRVRDKILRDVPEEFAAAGNELPAAEPAIAEAAENLLGRLRAKIETTAKGPVAFRYTIDAE